MRVKTFGSVALLITSCAGARPTPNAVAAQVTVEPQAGPKRHLDFHTAPCPLPEKQPGAPECFKKLTGLEHPALLRAEKSTCHLATQAQFVGNTQPALSALINIVEANTGSSSAFLREPGGVTHPVPPRVTAPLWVDGHVVGLSSDGKQRGYWANALCELPPEGDLTALASLRDGRFLALWAKPDRTVELVARSVEGAWSSFGPTLQAFAERLISSQGRVALMFDSTTSTPLTRDFGTEHPELGRTSIIGRLTEQGAYTEYVPVQGWVPLEPLPGATLSNAAAVIDGSLGGAPAIFLPRGEEGFERVPLPALALDRKDERCPQPDFNQRKTTAAWVKASPVAGLAWGPGILLARLESRGDCTAELREAPPRNCPPGAPCAPPQGPSVVTTKTENALELLLFNVGKKPGPVLRLGLPPRTIDDGGRFAGISLAQTDTELLVQAEGFLLVFERAALERSAP